MEFLEVYRREGGSAAQTGTATHAAISHFHKGKGVSEAIKAMRAVREEFPMADMIDAEKLFRLYAEDERNANAKLSAVEHKVHTAILHGEEEFFFEGTLDQIRETQEGAWQVWDVKTSRFDGDRILLEHTYQICAYAVLASRIFRRTVEPGGIIMVRDYHKKNGQVFYPCELDANDAADFMAFVVERIREIRRGVLIPIPGDHCKWCCGLKTCKQQLNLLGAKV